MRLLAAAVNSYWFLQVDQINRTEKTFPEIAMPNSLIKPVENATISGKSLPVNQILAGDCREVLATLPSNSVDLIFADPPYNLQLKNDLYRPNLSHVDAVNDDWDKFSSFAEYDRFTLEWLSACREVLKDTGTIFVIGSYHNIYRVGSIMQDLGFWILNDIIWLKSNPMPNFRGTRFCNAHETILWAAKSEKLTKYVFNYKAMKAGNEDLQMRSDWRLPICTGEERRKHNGEKAHTTQKPEALLYRIICACSNQGDVVLDPFFGTGTTGAVAKKLRRKWIGIEKEATYRQVAELRIAEIVPPLVEDETFPASLDAPKMKIAFSLLLEYGLIEAGFELRLGKSEHLAIVQEDGTLVCNGKRGSIHKLAAILYAKPSCNGWEHWLYQCKITGEYLLLDTLREKMRAVFEGEGDQNSSKKPLPESLTHA